jgi:hypothetical protein
MELELAQEHARQELLAESLLMSADAGKTSLLHHATRIKMGPVQDLAPQDLLAHY